MPTERTVEEAKAYITESINYWEENSEDAKIYSLANFAERRRSAGKKSPAHRLKQMQKNINALNNLIKRSKEIGIEDIEVYKKQLDVITVEYWDLSAEIQIKKDTKTIQN